VQNHLIGHELSQYEYLRAQVQRDFPDVDEETLNDTLAGMTDLPEMIAAVLRSALEDLALAKGLRGRVVEMQERLARLEDGAHKKRQLIISVMERAELRKLIEPDFTVTLRRTPPALHVVHEEDIPADFWRPQPPKLDRQAVTTALRGGLLVAGAMLDNGGTTIAIRTR
jgi:Siphovirus Gp157